MVHFFVIPDKNFPMGFIVCSRAYYVSKVRGRLKAYSVRLPAPLEEDLRLVALDYRSLTESRTRPVLQN